MNTNLSRRNKPSSHNEQSNFVPAQRKSSALGEIRAIRVIRIKQSVATGASQLVPRVSSIPFSVRQ
jgi:hypothetical protein